MKQIQTSIDQVARLRKELDDALVNEIRVIQRQQIGLIIGFVAVAVVMAISFVGAFVL